MVQMSTVEKESVKPFGFRPEFIAEQETVDGGNLYRFTFAPDGGDDLSEDFYRFITTHMSKMAYDHITIHCPNGHPAWLTSFFTKLNAYGLPVEVTPAPSDPALMAAIEGAARYTRFKWQDAPAAPVSPAAAEQGAESAPGNTPVLNGSKPRTKIEYVLTAALMGLILLLVIEPIQHQLEQGNKAGYVTAFVIGIVAILLATQARALVRVMLDRKR
jgi:hypothetical protein